MQLRNTLIATTLLATLSTSAHAWIGEERITDIKLGVFTHSYTDDKERELLETETNTYGLEIQHFINKPNQKTHWIGIGAGANLDNYNEMAYSVSGLYKYRWEMSSFINSIDFNLKLSLLNRTYREIESVVEGNAVFNEERETRLSLTPFITFNLTEHLNTDITWVPERWGANLTDDFGAFSVQIGYRF